ncbi:MAG: leucyl aminopeptidase family protein [Saprospiraceae bacterium]
MKISFQQSNPLQVNTFIIFFEEGIVEQDFIQKFTGLNRNIPFEGKAKECFRMLHPKEPYEVILVGLGKSGSVDTIWKEVRSAIFRYKVFLNGTVCLVGEHLSDRHIFQIVLGISLANKTNVSYKVANGSDSKLDINYVVQVSGPSAISEGEKALTIATTQEKVMRWIDTPSNIKTPAFIATEAVKSAKEFGYSCTVFDKDRLEKEGLFALLAVGQGSINPATMLVLEHNPSNKTGKKVGLVGKGITFDTGGLSIKPSANMGYMKSDMSGAAAMIGCIELAAKMKYSGHVVAVIPLAENSVDANSIRPGDVISSYSGKSIEVIDTDAEGRLVLADAVSFIIKNHQPDILIDMATLTGNIIQSLGYYASGLFCNNDELKKDLLEAGEKSDEKLWPMPLWNDYKQDMMTDIADIKNLSSKPLAGAITAAKFVEFFTEEHPAWAHIDIAGVAFTDSEFSKMRMATGYGVHLLWQFLETQANKK